MQWPQVQPKNIDIENEQQQIQRVLQVKTNLIEYVTHIGKHFQMRKIAYELVDIMLPGNQVLKSFVLQQFKAFGQIFFRTRGRS